MRVAFVFDSLTTATRDDVVRRLQRSAERALADDGRCAPTTTSVPALARLRARFVHDLMLSKDGVAQVQETCMCVVGEEHYVDSKDR